jgi:hypothetical protein
MPGTASGRHVCYFRLVHHVTIDQSPLTTPAMPVAQAGTPRVRPASDSHAPAAGGYELNKRRPDAPLLGHLLRAHRAARKRAGDMTILLEPEQLLKMAATLAQKRRSERAGVCPRCP